MAKKPRCKPKKKSELKCRYVPVRMTNETFRLLNALVKSIGKDRSKVIRDLIQKA